MHTHTPSNIISALADKLHNDFNLIIGLQSKQIDIVSDQLVNVA